MWRKRAGVRTSARWSRTTATSRRRENVESVAGFRTNTRRVLTATYAERMVLTYGLSARRVDQWRKWRIRTLWQASSGSYSCFCVSESTGSAVTNLTKVLGTGCRRVADIFAHERVVVWLGAGVQRISIVELASYRDKLFRSC